jgi:hypothetical protein
VVSLAVTNQHSAFPFSTFKNLFTKEFNPGVEVGYGSTGKHRPGTIGTRISKPVIFTTALCSMPCPFIRSLATGINLEQRAAYGSLRCRLPAFGSRNAVLELQK